MEQTLPISSAEAERGFSQMNLVATDFRSQLLVSDICDNLFVRLNWPLPHMLNPASAMKSWLLKGHRRADDTRSKLMNKTDEEPSNKAKLFSYD
jgi:hypothetical protein